MPFDTALATSRPKCHSRDPDRAVRSVRTGPQPGGRDCPGDPPAPAYSIPVFSRTFGSWRLSVDRNQFALGDLAAQYDSQSNAWHQIIQRHGFDQAYRGLIDRVMRQPRYRQEAGLLRVLDAGVGTGAMSSALRQHLGRRFQLDGIDISESMLRQAAARLEAQDIEARLQRTDLDRLPYPDNTFDVVLAAHVIEHVPDPQRAIEALFRVLKPGGTLICCITRASFIGAYIQLIWRTHRVSQATALGWLRQSGLHSVRAIPFTKHERARGFSLGYVGRKPNADPI